MEDLLKQYETERQKHIDRTNELTNKWLADYELDLQTIENIIK